METDPIRQAFTAAAFLIAALLLSPAAATDFQIKGRTLGMNESSACGDAPLTNLQLALEATGVKGIEFPATGCELALDSVAGLTPAGPARLLFWKGKLIRLIVEFEHVDLEEAAALRTAFISSFGRPVTKRSDPFRTDTWRSRKQVLELEWTDRIPADVSAYLTDSTGWLEYQKAEARARSAIKALDSKKRSDDLRN
ncbi:hypothetical protein [Thermomonas flagellata]|uniref:hypothetical protein n=1 Tax=Thermomonas flagellata TaxID=2888524 RepID=UPI001F03666F|nr:hypothetical protein [Thermomonas flagellata]